MTTKLRAQDIKEIHNLRAQGWTYRQIARHLGTVTAQQVGRICRDEAWSHIPPELTDEQLNARGAALLNDAGPVITLTPEEIDSIRRRYSKRVDSPVDPPDALDAYLNRRKT
jgi:hypothetical protein